MDRILFIEDEKELADLLYQCLSNDEFFIQTAENGTDGLYYVLDKSFDLVLMDVFLSDFDAMALCQMIRKEKDIPIIMICKKTDEDGYGSLFPRVIESGADNLIFIDDDPIVLLTHVRAALSFYHRVSKNHDSVKSLIKNDALQLDPFNRQVWLNGKEIMVTGKEFDILEYFMNHPGEVLSKEEIFQQVWGMDSFGNNSTVTVFVRKLRAKLQTADLSMKFIETVWGKGYRFRSNG